MFRFFKRRQPPKPMRWREFVGYVDNFMRYSDFAMNIIQKANELGLKGKRITVVTRNQSPTGAPDEIWFEGEMK